MVVVGKPEDVLAVKKAFGVNLVKLTDELRKMYKTEGKV